MNCEKCGRHLDYRDEFDSYYCWLCGVWTERECTDPNCEFCKDRPDYPEAAQP